MFTGSAAEKLSQIFFFIDIVEDMVNEMSNLLLGEKLPFAVVSTENGEILHPAYKKTTRTVLRRLATAYRDHIYANQDLWIIYCQNPQNHFSPWCFKKLEPIDSNRCGPINKFPSDMEAGPINNKILGLLFDLMSGKRKVCSVCGASMLQWDDKAQCARCAKRVCAGY